MARWKKSLKYAAEISGGGLKCKAIVQEKDGLLRVKVTNSGDTPSSIVVRLIPLRMSLWSNVPFLSDSSTQV